MGQPCCVPAKDANADLRGRRANQSRSNLQGNTFRQKLEEPEFKVTRRDSLCMAAKEHTEKIEQMRNEERDSTLVKSGLNTHGKQSMATSEDQQNNCYLAGTFAVDSNLQQVSEGNHEQNYQNPDEDEHPLPTMGAMSFGANESSLGESASEATSARKNRISKSTAKSNYVDISIRDIQEVRDKEPASPATTLSKANPQYFE